MASRKERVAIASAIASGSLAFAKFVVGVAIGSLALISDALHSVIDLGATLVTWYAVRVSDRPPDAEHHYGHGKIESLAALAEAGLLFLLAGGVVVEAVSRLRAGGEPVAFSTVAFVVLAADMAINGWRAHVLHRTAIETRSEALEADSLHFASDFFGTIPVVIGLALAAYGFGWADPVAAIAVALMISVLAFRLGRRTIGSLVDAAPTEFAERVDQSVRAVAGVVDVERVRMRRVGSHTFVEAAVNVPRTLSLDRISELKIDVRQAIEAVLGAADVTVSVAPVALDDETVMERVLVIARNRGLAVHHVTAHAIGERLAVSLDLEVAGDLTLAAAHEVADGLEQAVQAELGPEVEVETHIEPLQIEGMRGRDAPAPRIDEIGGALAELAGRLGPLRDVHDVRVRETPEGEVVNFHCRVDPALTVDAVHEAVDDVERALRRREPAVKRVIGHAEPRR